MGAPYSQVKLEERAVGLRHCPDDTVYRKHLLGSSLGVLSTDNSGITPLLEPPNLA